MSATLPATDIAAKALLVVAAQTGAALSLDDAVELGSFLLPRTPADRVRETVLGIAEHLGRARMYRNATPETARAWFGSCACDHNSALAFAECLHERAAVWAGEAETLAATAALRDRMAPSLAWKEPA